MGVIYNLPVLKRLLSDTHLGQTCEFERPYQKKLKNQFL
jgi:hypothetical protein